MYITGRAVHTERAIYTDASHPVCPYKVPLRECLSDSPSGGKAASSRGYLATGYTGDASGVGRANSRVNCFAISLATWSPPIHHGENANLKLRTFQKAPSFRNLSSNGVRYKFRERYKPQLQFLKIYAHKNLSRSLAHMVTDFGILSDYSDKLTVPQSASLTAPEVALQPVTQGMPPELAEPTRE